MKKLNEKTELKLRMWAFEFTDKNWSWIVRSSPDMPTIKDFCITDEYNPTLFDILGLSKQIYTMITNDWEEQALLSVKEFLDRCRH